MLYLVLILVYNLILISKSMKHTNLRQFIISISLIVLAIAFTIYVLPILIVLLAIIFIFSFFYTKKKKENFFKFNENNPFNFTKNSKRKGRIIDQE